MTGTVKNSIKCFIASSTRRRLHTGIEYAKAARESVPALEKYRKKN